MTANTLCQLCGECPPVESGFLYWGIAILCAFAIAFGWWLRGNEHVSSPGALPSPDDSESTSRQASKPESTGTYSVDVGGSYSGGLENKPESRCLGCPGAPASSREVIR